MRQTIVLPYQTAMTHSIVSEGLIGAENIKVVDDINELVAELTPIKGEEKLIVIDFGWADGYELAIQDLAKSPLERRQFIDRTPVICIHYSAPSLGHSLRKDMKNNLGVVGYVSHNHTFLDQGTYSSLRDIITNLQSFEGQITPEVFDNVTAKIVTSQPKRARGFRL